MEPQQYISAVMCLLAGKPDIADRMQIKQDLENTTDAK